MNFNEPTVFFPVELSPEECNLIHAALSYASLSAGAGSLLELQLENLIDDFEALANA